MRGTQLTDEGLETVNPSVEAPPAAPDLETLADTSLLEALATAAYPDPYWLEVQRRFQGRVTVFARSMLRDALAAEEVAQYCFVELWKTVVQKRGTVTHPKSWLYKLASRKSLRILQERRQGMETLEEQQASPKEAQAARAAEREELSRALYTMVDELPERLRVPLLLQYGAEHTQTEIAGILACRQSTVSERIAEGLEKLRDGLRRLGYAALPAAVPAMLNETLAVPAQATLQGLAFKPLAAMAVEHSRRLATPHGWAWAAKTWLLAAAGTVAVGVGALVWTQAQSANQPGPVPATQVAPAVTAPQETPPWHPYAPKESKIPGTVSGVWAAEPGAHGGGWRYTPNLAHGEQLPTYMYPGALEHASIEWRGVLHHTGSEEDCIFQLGVSHVNRVNFGGMVWKAARDRFPMAFTVQVWKDAQGCRLLMRLRDAKGQDSFSQGEQTWRELPWKSPDEEDRGPKSVWIKFKSMVSFGLAFAAHDALRIEAVQTRPLLKANLIQPLE